MTTIIKFNEEYTFVDHFDDTVTAFSTDDGKVIRSTITGGKGTIHLVNLSNFQNVTVFSEKNG